eukprot:2008422-Amphidinium_carterae.1
MQWGLKASSHGPPAGSLDGQHRAQCAQSVDIVGCNVYKTVEAAWRRAARINTGNFEQGEDPCRAAWLLVL